MKGDRRLTPARPDLAASHLIGEVTAARFTEPEAFRVTAPVAPLRPEPDAMRALDTELLFGEGFAVYDQQDGWAWGQSDLDGYVGYVPAAALCPAGALDPETHRVITLGANTYAVPRLKSPPMGTLPFSGRISVNEVVDGFARIGPSRWIPESQIGRIADVSPDWIAVAELFLGVPYVWGGRSSAGLDCSALIQLARQAAGHHCPRDSDMQETALGETLSPDERLKRGDLVFWRGHVGVMLDGTRLLHANGYHMSVQIEDLEIGIVRIAAAGGGDVTRRARLDAVESSH